MWMTLNGMSNFIKETPESSLAPSTMGGHSKKMLLVNQQQVLTRH